MFRVANQGHAIGLPPYGLIVIDSCRVADA
jgi:hypothetical protein